MKTSNNAPAKRVYVNAKQLSFLQSQAKRRGYVGGRASGKSTVLGHTSRMCINYLPKAKFFLAGLTYNHLLTTTVPAIIDAMTMHGFKEYDPKTRMGHYVLQKRPPSDWPQPYSPVRTYENTISFINGFALQLLSMDMPDRNRGGSYDGGFMDESALIKKDVVDKILMPSIRGNIYRFNHYLHGLFGHFTSVPWLANGQWVFDYENLSKQEPDKYFYLESTAYDNIDVLGEEYIKDLRDTLAPIVFDVEVMNKRLTKLPNGYYPAFDADKHTVFKTFDYQYDEETGIYLTSDSFYRKDKAIDISFDFNGKIVSALIGQEAGNEYHLIDELFIKTSTYNLIDNLIDNFCNTYASHTHKVLNIYGDSSGNVKMANSNLSYYEQIINRFKSKGWINIVNHVGLSNDEHKIRHFIINSILTEENKTMPKIKFSLNKCKFTIISIQNAPILSDFKKDKRSETTYVEQERATHLSDCFDYIVLRKFGKSFGRQSKPYKARFIGSN
jgi:hypothetical protein